MLILLVSWAFAVCPSPSVAAVTCGDEVDGQLDAGTWGGATPPGACDAGFNALDSDLGASACAATNPQFCATIPQFAGWSCSQGPSYACGTVAFGEGPEDVYDFLCPSSGVVQVDLTGIDCDLDLYLLPAGSCNPGSCTAGSTNGAVSAEGFTSACIPGQLYAIVVEGFGFTQGGYSDGGAAYCATHTANPRGSYTLEVTCVPDVPDEDCDTAGDEDGDGDADCADSDCFAEVFCCDDDQDGFDDAACGGGDCDDAVFDAPAADADSDGVVDACDVCPGTADPLQADSDGDGFGDLCDVCPGVDDLGDADHDGSSCADDCDDADPLNFPGNTEQCDLQDNDCDDDIDESVVTTDYWPDLDEDGYGDPAGAVVATCAGTPPHTVNNTLDCDDTHADTNPGEVELEDGRDNDCDGVVDEGTARFDDDLDGFTELGGDCDDGDPTVRPTALETCDGIDEDCDGVPDDGTACFDDDGDGYCEGPTCVTGLPGDCNDADAHVSPAVTEVPDNGLDDDCNGEVDGSAYDPDGDGITESAGDCGPHDPTVHPGAPELDDGLDNDCDGVVDEGTPTHDDDGDGASEVGGDCNDADAAISPAATELENGIDDDCDGAIDEGTNAGDDDGDGFTENGGDCDDTDDDLTPGARELPNGIDDDCDGEIDEGLSDRDRDGYTTDDCNDDDGFVNPGIAEICDLVDNDCDGVVDEGCVEDTDVPPPDTRGCQTAPWPGFGLLWRRR